MTAPSRVRNRLIAGTIVLFLARALLSAIRSGPVLVADEIGYLTNARLLAGGLAGQMHMAPFYRGGYSLLIAPLAAIDSHPTLAYHLILLVNAALAASLFPLLYLLLTRFVDVPSGVALWAALAGALYPAVTVLSQVAMSENALFPLVCLWLIAFGGLLAARQAGSALLWAAGLGTATVALWAVHNRMVTAVALTAVVLLWLGLRRRLHPGAVALGLGLIALGIFGTHLLDDFIVNHNYGGHAPNEAGDRIDALFRGHGLRTMVANLAGQTWYLAVATFGLAAVAMAQGLGGLRRLRGGGAIGVVGLLAALTILLLLISAAAFPERTRPDMLIYGRYAEIAAPPLVAVGLAALHRMRLRQRLRVPLLAFAILTGVLVIIRATASDPNAANRWNVSSLPFITFELGPGVLIGAAAVAAIGALLLVRASARAPRSLGALAVGLFAAVVLYGAWNPVGQSQRAVYPSGWSSPGAVAAADHVGSVSYDLSRYDTIGLYTVQWFLPHTAVRLFRGDREPPRGRYVLSGSSWPRDHREPGARPLWRFEGRDQVLWRLPTHQAH